MEDVSYEYWCDYERGVADKIYPAGSVYIALSASSNRCTVLAEAAAIADASRWAVFIPKHHPHLFAELFSSYAWPLLYARANQGINFKYEDLKNLVFPKMDNDRLDEMDSILEMLDKQIAEEELKLNQFKRMKDFFQDRMFC